MTLEELFDRITAVGCQEVRSRESGYLEVVVAAEKMDAMKSLLAGYFGQPSKPAGQGASTQAKRLAEAHGGIQTDQTLYLKEGGAPEIAMLWPWGSGRATTVKLARVLPEDKPVADDASGSWLTRLLRPRK